jgi:hypothetical protein
MRALKRWENGTFGLRRLAGNFMVEGEGEFDEAFDGVVAGVACIGIFATAVSMEISDLL